MNNYQGRVEGSRRLQLKIWASNSVEILPGFCLLKAIKTMSSVATYLFCLFLVPLNSFSWQAFLGFLLDPDTFRLNSLQFGLGLPTLFMIKVVRLHGLFKQNTRNWTQ